MERRDLLKLGLLIAGGATLSGCKSDKTNIDVSSDVIIPKQTATYEFSIPMFFDFKGIDKLAEYNQKYKKSQITSLYNSIPWPLGSVFNEWAQLSRQAKNTQIKSFNDFKKYAKHAMNYGFDIHYTLNSPKPFNMKKDFKTFEKPFYKLLEDLWDIGITKLKIGNTQVATLVREFNPNFELYGSTLLEYHTVSQYENLFELIPQFEGFCVAKNENQNFKFLKALRIKFPNMKLELMLDEGCVKSCPTRIPCMAGDDVPTYKKGCRLISESWVTGLFTNGRIHPWQIPYYSAIGYNNFKLVATRERVFDKYCSILPFYLEYLEHGFEGDIRRFFERFLLYKDLRNPNLAFQDFIKLYPDIEHFIKYGHECSYSCRVTCNYCYDKAQKFQDMIDKANENV